MHARHIYSAHLLKMSFTSALDSVEQLLAESEALLQSIRETPPSPSTSPRSRFSSSSVTQCSNERTLSTRTPAASSSSCRPVLPLPKAKRSRNSTRDRQQSELQFLRRHVCELEAEAARLLLSHRNGARVDSDGNNESSSTSRRDTPRSVSAWQRLAQRQQKARAMCEQQKQSLTRQVMERATLIRGIRELLRAHQSALNRRNVLNSRHALVPTGWDEAAVFARLKQDAVRAFERSEHVLAENGIGRHGGSMSDLTEDNVLSQGYDEQSQRFVSRLVSTRVFPFDVHATSNATWRAIVSTLFTEATGSGDHTANETFALQSNVHVIERSDTTFAVSYIVTLNVTGVDLVVRARDVITRCASATEGEWVFVWQTALESACGSDTVCRVTPQSQIQGSGWLVFQQSPNACSSSVLRSVFEFHTMAATDYDECEDNGDTINEDAVKVQVLKVWTALGEGCIDTIALHVDKSLLAC